jgi:Gas vesicle synthesis protein GvpL/GvpF
MSLALATRNSWLARHGSRRWSARRESPADPRVIWVYGITDNLQPGQIAGLTGVAGEPVHAVAEAGLIAVVGSVDARTFGEQALAPLLADLARIERLGWAHHQVIACIAAGGPVLPLRLATICRDDHTVRRLLARRSSEFAVLLETLRGTQEWGVKLYRVPGTGGVPPDDDPETCTEVIDHALSDIAIASRRHPACEPLTETGESMVFNGSYLLRGDRAAEFAAVANALARAQTGVRAQLTGPWPPYSFAEPQEP